MDQATSLVLVAGITMLGTAVPSTLTILVQGRANKLRQEAMKAVVDETAQRGREGRAQLNEMQSVMLDTHGQVTTLNGKSLGELADATETRRVDVIPTGERTAAEAQHIATIPAEPEPEPEPEKPRKPRKPRKRT